MRPVNLLPEQHRPRVATGGRSGSAYVVIGVLAAILMATVAYALTANRVNSLKEDTRAAEAEAAEAEARAAVLAPFAQFQQVKETRFASVSGLAQSRVDWERLSRELAHVFPDGAWLTEVNALTTPSAEGTTTSSATSTSPSGSQHLGPTVTVAGCAKSQPIVARMLVRLRRLDRAEGAELVESSRGEGEGGAGQSSSGSSSAGSDCGKHYVFEAKVELAPVDPVGTLENGTGRQVEVPASLGGGS